MRAIAGSAFFVARAVALVVLFLLFAVSCGGAEDEESTPSPTPPAGATATAPPEASPTSVSGEQPQDAEFRAFAADLDTAIKTQPVDFLRERMRTRHIVCRQEDVEPRGPGGPACESVGQEFDGFEVSAWRSEGATVPVETAVRGLDAFFSGTLPDESDAFGGGEPQVYALNVGGGRYDAIVTAIIERPTDIAGEGPLRVALNTSWAFEEGRWLLTGVMYAYVLADELLTPALEARGLFPNWERFGDG
ncbi:MAG: hypothetical protein QME71_06340 [Dehalococcoidia bacterium]|nr:hypothetical protein [Dehalococcoidia bacterium]